METDEQEAIEEAESRKLDALLRQQRINTINTLKSQNERLVRIVEEAPNILCNVAQLLDGWHNDGTVWSEWDESVRKEVSRLQTLVEAALAMFLSLLELRL